MYDSHGSFAEGYAVGRDTTGANCNAGGMGWGGDWFWGIILIALLFNNGNWGNGWGNGGNFGGGFVPYAVGNSYTDSAIQRGFDTQAIIGKLDGINQGLCDGFYAMNTGMLNATNNLSAAVCNLGYENAQLANQTQMAIMQGNNALSSQLADCCCKTQTAIAGVNNAITGLGCSLGREIERGFADTNYNMATNTCALQTSIANSTRDIIDSQREGTRAVIDWLCAKETADLRAENQNLKLAASQERQNQYLVNTLRPCPSPAYITCNPFTGTYGGYAGYGNAYNNCGCGCNSGCGC